MALRPVAAALTITAVVTGSFISLRASSSTRLSNPRAKAFVPLAWALEEPDGGLKIGGAVMKSTYKHPLPALQLFPQTQDL